MSSDVSLRDRLRAARQQHTANIECVPIPGYNGQLYARYGMMGWAEIRKVALGNLTPAAELEAFADLLIAACEGVEAHVDGRVVDLAEEGVTGLGTALADFLGIDTATPEGRMSDRQSVFAIFPSEMAIVRHANRLGALAEAIEDEADGEIAGN